MDEKIRKTIGGLAIAGGAVWVSTVLGWNPIDMIPWAAVQNTVYLAAGGSGVWAGVEYFRG